MANAQQAQRIKILSRDHWDAERPLGPDQENVRSTKPKARPYEKTDAATLQGKKVRDVYTNVYEVRNTVFSNQTGKFPTRSKRGNKYIMFMVEIYSNAILVEPIKNCTDAELTRAYHAMMLQLK